MDRLHALIDDLGLVEDRLASLIIEGLVTPHDQQALTASAVRNGPPGGLRIEAALSAATASRQLLESACGLLIPAHGQAPLDRVNCHLAISGGLVAEAIRLDMHRRACSQDVA